MDRRTLHKTMSALGLSLAATSLGGQGASAQDGNEVEYFTWAGYELPEFRIRRPTFRLRWRPEGGDSAGGETEGGASCRPLRAPAGGH